VREGVDANVSPLVAVGAHLMGQLQSQPDPHAVTDPGALCAATGWAMRAMCVSALVGSSSKTDPSFSYWARRRWLHLPSCCSPAALDAALTALPHRWLPDGEESEACHDGRKSWPEVCGCHAEHRARGQRYALAELWNCLVDAHDPAAAAATRWPQREGSDTVLVVASASPISAVKLHLLRRLVNTSSVPVYVFNDEGTTDQSRLRRDVAAIEAAGARYKAQDLPRIEAAFGGNGQLGDFGGRSQRLRHLPSLIWLAHSHHVRYAWVLEDDVYVRNTDAFLASYQGTHDDLIAARHSNEPSVERTGTNRLVHAQRDAVSPPMAVGGVLIPIMRWSRSFARSALRTVRLEQSTDCHLIAI